MPAIRPMAMRPAGPIQLLSKANFRKYETPISTAEIPIRFSQCEPMRDSRSRALGRPADARAGAGGGLGPTAGGGATEGGAADDSGPASARGGDTISAG